MNQTEIKEKNPTKHSRVLPDRSKAILERIVSLNELENQYWKVYDQLESLVDEQNLSDNQRHVLTKKNLSLYLSMHPAYRNYQDFFKQ